MGFFDFYCENKHWLGFIPVIISTIALIINILAIIEKKG
jgi:hypothetical protein